MEIEEITTLEDDQQDDQSNCVRGKPKSGRPWKTVKDRYSSLVKVKPLRTSWETKMKVKRERKIAMSHEKQIRDDKKTEKEEVRKRIADRKKREELNAKRAEIVQPIKNTAKIRRMKKKQLRLLEKR